VKVEKYPHFRHTLNLLKEIGAPGGGIIVGRLGMLNRLEGFPDMHCISAMMPNYLRATLGEVSPLPPHLGGYGVSLDESITKLLGEAIERYALFISMQMYRDDIIYASYRELKQAGEDAIPKEYLDVFSEGIIGRLKDVKFARTPLFSKFTEEDQTGWIRCKSIFNSNREILVPAHAIFPVYKTSPEHREKVWLPSISTGCACHPQVEQALVNSILEYFERDSFTLKWYTETPSPEVILDDPIFTKFVGEFLGPRLGLVPLYSSLPDCPVHVFSAFLINRIDRRPLISCGAAAGLDPQHTLYRAIAESSATGILSLYAPIYLPEVCKIQAGEVIGDLDRNVSLFASPTQREKKELAVNKIKKGNKSLLSLPNLSRESPRENLGFLIKALKKVSEWTVFLDITPPEVSNLGYRVVRVFAPELLPLCLPSFPPDRHPRMMKYGGVKNRIPHPMP
jgi:thiazole/oxazole-forming peptide maturase SagD family component